MWHYLCLLNEFNQKGIVLWPMICMRLNLPRASESIRPAAGRTFTKWLIARPPVEPITEWLSARRGFYIKLTEWIYTMYIVYITAGYEHCICHITLVKWYIYIQCSLHISYRAGYIMYTMYIVYITASHARHWHVKKSDRNTYRRELPGIISMCWIDHLIIFFCSFMAIYNYADIHVTYCIILLILC
jgi:hypothetical protein